MLEFLCLCGSGALGRSVEGVTVYSRELGEPNRPLIAPGINVL